MDRIARVQAEMTCQAAVVVSGVNRFYLTGFSSSAGTIFITKRQSFLLVDSRYYSSAER